MATGVTRGIPFSSRSQSNFVCREVTLEQFENQIALTLHTVPTLKFVKFQSEIALSPRFNNFRNGVSSFFKDSQ